MKNKKILISRTSDSKILTVYNKEKGYYELPFLDSIRNNITYIGGRKNSQYIDFDIVDEYYDIIISKIKPSLFKVRGTYMVYKDNYVQVELVYCGIGDENIKNEKFTLVNFDDLHNIKTGPILSVFKKICILDDNDTITNMSILVDTCRDQTLSTKHKAMIIEHLLRKTKDLFYKKYTDIVSPYPYYYNYMNNKIKEIQDFIEENKGE